jgi:hypothetical protein
MAGARGLNQHEYFALRWAFRSTGIMLVENQVNVI